MLELDENEKERIRIEEALRMETRTALEALQSSGRPRTQGSRVWGFLNSSFGLWLLSSVLITGLGTLYSNYQNRTKELSKIHAQERAAAADSKDKHDRLALEFSFRLSASLSILDQAERLTREGRQLESFALIERALDRVLLPPTSVAPPLYPEFQGYSGVALVAEARRHASIGESELLKEVLHGAAALTYESTSSRQTSGRGPREVASLLLEKLKFRNWGYGFPYMDCTVAEPFC